jgi:hypothetical protein
MTNAILRQVRESFDFLVQEYGFAVTQEVYDAQNFGNVLMRFESPDQVVKITIDRGQVFVEIGATAAPAATYDLAVILRYLTRQEWSYDFEAATSTQLAALARVLKSHAREIFQAQLVRTHRAELDAIVQQQFQERLAEFKRWTQRRGTRQ